MTKTNKKQEVTIESISYVNDPDAAKKWFDIYLEIVKKELLKEVSRNDD